MNPTMLNRGQGLRLGLVPLVVTVATLALVAASYSEPVELESATAAGNGATVTPRSVMIVGQPLVGLMTNGVHTLRVGAVEGLLLQRPGDFDRNRRLDLEDWMHFDDCLTGPRTSATGACLYGDADGDADTDLADLAAFANGFTN